MIFAQGVVDEPKNPFTVDSAASLICELRSRGEPEEAISARLFTSFDEAPTDLQFEAAFVQADFLCPGPTVSLAPTTTTPAELPEVPPEEFGPRMTVETKKALLVGGGILLAFAAVTAGIVTWIKRSPSKA